MAAEFRNLDDDTPAELAPGARMAAVVGASGMLNRVELDAGAVVPPHSHPHEQIGYVISGEILMEVEGRAIPCGPGMAYAIPGGAVHGGTAGPDGCVVIDVFVPVRDEYVGRIVAARGG